MARSSKKSPRTVFVSPMPDKGWKVKSSGSAHTESIHKTKSDAVNRGRELSRAQNAELVVQTVSGRISERGSAFKIPIVRAVYGEGRESVSSTKRRTLPVKGTKTADRDLDVAAIRSLLGVSQAVFSRITGYSIRSVAGWESGAELSASARQKLAETKRLAEALLVFFGPDQLGHWLESPNPAFEGQTPVQLIERGESDRLWKMVFTLNAGVAS